MYQTSISVTIDKAKIGKDVKGIPKTWVNREYINEMDIDDSERIFLKSIMLDRHPYFFIHLYAKTKKDYKVFMDEYNFSSIHKFGVSLKTCAKREQNFGRTKIHRNILQVFACN